MQLDGRVAVVTGGGAETGRAIALRLAAAGALVVVADVDLAAAEQTVRAIEEQDGRAAAIAADVTDDGDVQRMIDFAGRDGGGPHVLVNNAGGWGEANYLEATPAQWSATLDLNLRGPMLATQLALEPMRAAGGGVVVNIASIAGIDTDAYASPEYGAAKAGLIRFTTALERPRRTHERARELRRARLDRHRPRARRARADDRRGARGGRAAGADGRCRRRRDRLCPATTRSRVAWWCCAATGHAAF